MIILLLLILFRLTIMCLYRIISLETGGEMSKHRQWNLRPNQMINLNKKFSDLKEKQKAKIAEWLYLETYFFYKDHEHMPNHSERQAILGTVYALIEEADIWIPYKEVERYYSSKTSRYRSRVLRDIENNVTYPIQKDRNGCKTEKREKPHSVTMEPCEFMDDYFAFIAGYTSCGAPYGLTWEDVGIPSDLPYDEKIQLYMDDFPEELDDLID